MSAPAATLKWCNRNIPRLLIAGLKGSGGKSIVAVGLAAAWSQRGVAVAPFKKGMDYIDAAWLTTAADRPCRNLDLFMIDEQAVRRSFIDASVGHQTDVAQRLRIGAEVRFTSVENHRSDSA